MAKGQRKSADKTPAKPKKVSLGSSPAAVTAAPAALQSDQVATLSTEQVAAIAPAQAPVLAEAPKPKKARVLLVADKNARGSVEDMKGADLHAYARKVGIMERDIQGLTEDRLRQNIRAMIHAAMEDD